MLVGDNMVLLDGKETRQINVLHGDFIMTYVFDVDLKKYNSLKKELINKYGIQRQLNKHDVLLNEKSLLEIVYEDAAHNNKYSSIEIIDYCSYNTYRVRDVDSPLYGHTLTSYVATIRDIPAICVVADLILHSNTISLEYLEKYLNQIEEMKNSFNNGNNIISLDLLRNNDFNIKFKEREIDLKDLNDIILSVINCFKIVGKYAKCLDNLKKEDMEIASNNAKTFETLLNIITKEEKEKVLTLKM